MKALKKPNPLRWSLYLAGLGFAVATPFTLTAAVNEQTETELEEVVVEGSRLQGSAQAVLDERKNQAFVADILGSEQISRTGDSDAASALRRVTGLTLLDGKFIYVRGLGERYSSTMLNSAQVPSPDPTRSVLPLDLFPAGILESLNVLKAYSPELPAHFAGGNVDIRTKSIPNEPILRFKAQLGFNSDNNDSVWYAGGSDDSFGNDDGTRALPASLAAVLSEPGVSGLSSEQAVAVLSSLNRDISSDMTSIEPDYGFDFTWGDKMDIGGESAIGFLATMTYRNEWTVSEERTVNNLARSGDEIRINEFADGASTEHEVRWSGMLNLGFDLDENHRFALNNIYLKDTKDRLRNRIFENTNTINEDNESRRKIDVVYEERELLSHQLTGEHLLTRMENIAVNWYYSYSETERYAPGGFETTLREDILDDGSIQSQLARDINTNYGFQQLDDEVTSYGIDLSYVLYKGNQTIEFKGGSDFVEKDRASENIGLVLQTFSIPSQFLGGTRYSDILSDAALANPDFTIRLDDSTSDGDKYRAATVLDAYYFMVDADLSAKWRLAAGVRYEDFRQVAVPFQPHSNFFSVETQELGELPLEESGSYPSIGLTYIQDSAVQYRFNYSETAIRPDFRDASTSFYIDPLTEFLVRGSTSIQSSDIKNLDFRWEWYMETGENLSVALFWKDITNPIEQIELPSATEGAPQLLTANAETGELYGMEIEFLKDLSFIGDNWSNYFLTGNLTLSESEVTICQTPGDDSCIFEEQLRQALNTDQAVTSVITTNTRRLIGHSEWVANLQLGWDSLDNEHAATLVYNVFGPRIIVPGVNGFEDAEEDPFHSLDLVYTWYPDFNSTVKVRVKNLLGETKEIQQEGVALLRETAGTELSIQYTYEF
jgi:outer membrane receptor protein involved in Fe transport